MPRLHFQNPENNDRCGAGFFLSLAAVRLRGDAHRGVRVMHLFVRNQLHRLSAILQNRGPGEFAGAST